MRLQTWGGPEPLVSCLMVTQAARWENGVPPGAQSFLTQTYQQRSLFILADRLTERMHDFAEGWEDEIFLFEPPAQGLPLGALRQMTVEESDGEFVANWDDDDSYSPDRLAAQVTALQGAFTSDACLLARWRVEDVQRGRRFVSPYFTWEGSMVARRERMPKYDPALRIGEDSALIAQFHQILLLDRPDVYTYRVHGSNTVGSDGRADDWWRARTGEDWTVTP